jgi:hypothetical protein
MVMTGFAVIGGLAAMTPTDHRDTRTAILILVAGFCAAYAR